MELAGLFAMSQPAVSKHLKVLEDVGFHGVYREIVAPERIVHTEIFEPFPEEETVCTVTLDERDGKTY